MEHALRQLAEEHLPSVSALVGPLLAARLCVEAHGRQRLARLPSGTVQILGAEKAFFHHLKTGAPSPKHGHIFMHPWIEPLTPVGTRENRSYAGRKNQHRSKSGCV